MKDLEELLGELFDARFYRERHPEVAESGASELAHYVAVGDAAGWWPHPLFDPLWYGSRHPELETRGGARLRHFAETPRAECGSPHPLFDTTWYVERYGDRLLDDEHPLVHYVSRGEAQGCWPNPLFDPAHYLAANPDVAGWSPLLQHYAEHGADDGRSPNALFDVTWYSNRHPELADAGIDALAYYASVGDARGDWPHPLFDPEYYGARHPELPRAGGARLRHFFETRGATSPHPSFDPDWYEARHPEVAATGENPLIHYLKKGEARGYRPNPFFDPNFYESDNDDLPQHADLLRHWVLHGATEERSPGGLFDAVWYRARHPDASRSGTDPLSHYLATGDAEDYWPNPLFDPVFYAEQHPELARSGGSRLRHYLEEGGPGGASPHPLFQTDRIRSGGSTGAHDERTPLERYLASPPDAASSPHPLFDACYYLAANPDVAGGSQPLLVHYLVIGAREGRKPNPLFDPAWYVAELEKAGIQLELADALTHFVTLGDSAGATPHPLFDPAWYRETWPGVADSDAGALTHFLEKGAEADFDPHPLFDSAWYRAFYDLADDEIPVHHYIAAGPEGDTDPNPLFDGSTYRERQEVELRPDETPLAHFVRVGIRRRLRPGAHFDFCVQFFRQRDPGLRARGANPLAGYLREPVASMTAPEAELRCAFADVEEPAVTVVIPAHGPVTYTLACLRALARAETDRTFEVVVVDDGTEAGDTDPLAAVEGIRLVRNSENQGFLRSCNRAAALARGEYLVFLNNDTLPTDGWLDALVETAVEWPRVGVVGSRLLYPNGKLQEAGGVVFRDGNALNYGCRRDPDDLRYLSARRADYVSAASLLVPRELFERLGGFDEAFTPAFYEDTDLAFRARAAGWDVVYQPGSTVIHFGGATYGLDTRRGPKRHQVRNRRVFAERWAEELASHGRPEDDLEPAIQRYSSGDILVIDSTTLTPDQDSGSLRMFNMLRTLRNIGYTVTFAPMDWSAPPRYTDLLRHAGAQVVGPPYVESIERFLELTGPRYDLCILSRPEVGARWLDATRLLCPRAKVLYDTVDLHFLRRDRELEIRGKSNLTMENVEDEISSCRRADGALVVSEFDRLALRDRLPGVDAFVLGNIHEVEPTLAPFEARHGMLFIGGFRHPPNRDGLLWFVREVLPLVHERVADLPLHVVGSEMPDEIRELASERVTIHGYLEDVVPLFEHVRLSVAPLRYGSGVKGKVNQSMSLGVPCVATSIAAEGIDARPGDEILVADAAREFADAVVAAHEDPELWARLAANSVRSVERTFSMEVAEERLRDILKQLGP